MIIDPGQLDRPITVRRFTLVPGDFNDVEVWEDHLSAWAMIRRVSEDEIWSTQQVYAQRTVTFTTHWFSDIRETDRIVCEGLEYDILGIGEIGLREGLEIKAEVRDP